MATRLPDSLQTYLWEGINSKGQRTKGETNAESPALLQSELLRQGIVARKIVKKPKSIFSFIKRTPKIKSLDILLFTRQLSTMLAAGLPIIKAFEIIGSGHENPSMEVLISSIKDDVTSGNPLAESLAKHPKYFDHLYCNLISAGEHSGTLDTMLARISAYLEKAHTLKKKVKKAIMYPLVVLSTAFIASAILLIFIVPRFQGMFNSFGAELPFFTQMVVNLSNFLQHYWWLIFGIIFLIIWGFIKARQRLPKFAYQIDKMMLNVPIMGTINQKVIIARITRNLSTTIAAGMPIVNSFDSVIKVIENRVHKEALQKVREEVSAGQKINVALKASKLYPSLVIKMIAVGEESGALENMLNKVAGYYEEDVDSIVDNLSSLLEPLIMLILGVIIGGFVIAMYLPIFKLGSVL